MTTLPYGTLSNSQIMQALREKLIHIDPFDAENLGTNTYDVRLGDWFYREQNPLTRMSIYNIYDKQAIDRVWGQPQRAQTYGQLMALGLLPSGLTTLHPDEHLILIAPGETILAHTIEFIGGRATGKRTSVTTKMHARSSMGRSFIGVCKCAGMGDAGFINRWTMEITSFAQHHWIPLAVGRRIAQIEFSFLSDVQGTYSGRKYQEHNAIEDVKKNWHPSIMLPRLYLDSDIQPIKLLKSLAALESDVSDTSRQP